MLHKYDLKNNICPTPKNATGELSKSKYYRKPHQYNYKVKPTQNILKINYLEENKIIKLNLCFPLKLYNTLHYCTCN